MVYLIDEGISLQMNSRLLLDLFPPEKLKCFNSVEIALNDFDKSGTAINFFFVNRAQISLESQEEEKLRALVFSKKIQVFFLNNKLEMKESAGENVFGIIEKPLNQREVELIISGYNQN